MTNLCRQSARKAVQHAEWHRLGETRVPYSAKPITTQWIVEKLGCVGIDTLLDLVSHQHGNRKRPCIP